jgi:hypothetical protein
MEEAAAVEVQPIYVRVGLAWEDAERQAIEGFIEAARLGNRVRPLAVLAVDMTDVYPRSHWAIQGRPPGYHTPDEDVYLPGRNVILLRTFSKIQGLAGLRLNFHSCSHRHPVMSVNNIKFGFFG